MVRRHGWQLPAHTFQVVAITVFFLLVVAFYAFFAPFLGKHIIVYVAIAVYTPVALAVFFLYVRCTRINPADPGIMAKFDEDLNNIPNNNLGLQNVNLPANFGNIGTGTHSSPLSASRSSIDGNYSRKDSAGAARRIDFPSDPPRKRSSPCCFIGGIFCALFVKDDCRKQEEVSDQQVAGEDALFCTLCNAEVDVFSFGIVMWEILTGEEPYANIHYGAIIGGIMNNTLRPPVPISCDPEWRRLMEQCWVPDPVQRKSFTEIASRLHVMSVALENKPHGAK